MALPALVERQQRYDRGIKPTPLKSGASSSSSSASLSAMPSSLSKVGPILTSASGKRAQERDLNAGSSLPRSTSTLSGKGVLYPSINGAAKRAGNLTSRTDAADIALPHSARESAAETIESPTTPRPKTLPPPSLIPVARAVHDAPRDASADAAAGPQELPAQSDNRDSEPPSKASVSISDAIVAAPFVATSSAASPIRARRTSAKSRSSLSMIKSPTSSSNSSSTATTQPIKRSSRLSRLSNDATSTALSTPQRTPRAARAKPVSTVATSVAAQQASSTDEEFLKRLEDAMRMGDDVNAFVDRRRAEMRKSTRTGMGQASAAGEEDAEDKEEKAAQLLDATDEQQQKTGATHTDEMAARPVRRSLRSSLPVQHPSVDAGPAEGQKEQRNKFEETTSLQELPTTQEDAVADPSTPRSTALSFAPFKVSAAGPNASPVRTPGTLHRLDPEMRVQRVSNAEISELRRTLAGRERELERVQKSLMKAKEDADGWKAECEAEVVLSAQSRGQVEQWRSKWEQEKRRREEAELHALQVALSKDEMEWDRLTGVRAQQSDEEIRRVKVQMTICRNEATYQTFRAQELEKSLAAAKRNVQELRVSTEKGGGDSDGNRLQEVELKLKEEKERRRTIARQGMKVEEERNEALAEAEELREQLDKLNDAAAVASASASSSAALRKAQGRAEAEEKRRVEVEKELLVLKKSLAAGAPSAIRRDAIPKALAPSSSPPRTSVLAARSGRKAPLAMDLSIDSEEEQEAEEKDDAQDPIGSKANAAVPPKKAKNGVVPKSAKAAASSNGTAAARKQAGKTKKRGMYEESSESESDRGAALKICDSSFDDDEAADVGKTKKGGSSSKTHASSSAPARPTTAAVAVATTGQAKAPTMRKRKSVEADEERRKALEAEIMATPMIKTSSRNAKVQAPSSSSEPIVRPLSTSQNGSNKASSASASASALDQKKEREAVQLKDQKQKPTAPLAPDDGGRKKKRKLLGAAAASSNGFFAWGSSEGDVSQGCLDVELGSNFLMKKGLYFLANARSGSPSRLDVLIYAGYLFGT